MWTLSWSDPDNSNGCPQRRIGKSCLEKDQVRIKV
jgi:hypothetical protein